jgi:succinate dehydrogenase / fumarate reductase, flavoprotein subunit
MGGIPTNKYGEVVIDENNTVLPGLYAAGECACVSVHGANRLGTNSLVDLIVFGKHAGLDAASYASQADFIELPAGAAEFSQAAVEKLRLSRGREKAGEIGREMKAIMFDEVGVFRTAAGLKTAQDKLVELRSRFQEVALQDRGMAYNTELVNTWELGNLLDLALVTTASARARTESRGAHAREDFPKRDDDGWLKHTLAWLDGDTVRLDYKPVTITRFQPKERTY